MSDQDVILINSDREFPEGLAPAMAWNMHVYLQSMPRGTHFKVKGETTYAVFKKRLRDFFWRHLLDPYEHEYQKDCCWEDDTGKIYSEFKGPPGHTKAITIEERYAVVREAISRCLSLKVADEGMGRQLWPVYEKLPRFSALTYDESWNIVHKVYSIRDFGGFYTDWEHEQPCPGMRDQITPAIPYKTNVEGLTAENIWERRGDCPFLGRGTRDKLMQLLADQRAGLPLVWEKLHGGEEEIVANCLAEKYIQQNYIK